MSCAAASSAAVRGPVSPAGAPPLIVAPDAVALDVVASGAGEGADKALPPLPPSKEEGAASPPPGSADDGSTVASGGPAGSPSLGV